MATHPTAGAPSASGNKTNAASLLMDDDTFDLDDAALALAVDSIIENHNKESEKVKREEEERERRKKREGKRELLSSQFDREKRAKRTQRDPTTSSLSTSYALNTDEPSPPFNTFKKNRRRAKEEALERRREQQTRASSSDSSSDSNSARPLVPPRLLVTPLRPSLHRRLSAVPSPRIRAPEPRQRLRCLRRSLRLSEGLLSG